MSESAKQPKISTESMIGDIATSIESMSKSLKSINESHSNLLRVNKAVIALKLKLDEEELYDLNTSVSIPKGKLYKK